MFFDFVYWLEPLFEILDLSGLTIFTFLKIRVVLLMLEMFISF